MNFKNFNTIQLAENVTLSKFIKNVSSYSSLDDALAHLDDEYTEWYLLNINSKKLNSELKKINLVENLHNLYNLDDNKTLGFSTKEKPLIKQIKYKGQYITVEYNRELGSWFPAIRFRSITTALKYIKNQVDYFEKNV